MVSEQPDMFDDGEIDINVLRQPDIFAQLEMLADKYAQDLDKQIKLRVSEMEQDDKSHYLIYQVLRISENRSRFEDYSD